MSPIPALVPRTGRRGKLGAATGTAPFVLGVDDQGSLAGESNAGRVCLDGGVSYTLWENWSCLRVDGGVKWALYWDLDGAGGIEWESIVDWLEWEDRKGSVS